MTEQHKTILIRLQDFVSPPYWKCPKCGVQDSFGVLGISARHYSRRCKSYSHFANYNLPKLQKKIIYIDQMAISNLMKALNPNTNAFQNGGLDRFWLDLFDKIFYLCKAQIIVCPSSNFHLEESAIWQQYFMELKRMYELLSSGLHFDDHDTIERFQVCDFAEKWIKGEKNPKVTLDRDSIIHGDLNGWQERYMITAGFEVDEGFINGLREERDKIHEGLAEVFQRWQREKNKSFDDWYKEEINGSIKVNLDVYMNHIKKLSSPINKIEDLYPPNAVIIFISLKEIFKRAGIKDEGLNLFETTVRFLHTSSIENIPIINISCLLFAALARKAAAGQKRLPSKGMNNDIKLISAFLPYCDAMFIDDECANFLREEPICSRLKYKTKIFSQNSKEQFLAYLDNLANNIPKNHMEKVIEVYGDDWLKPYNKIY